MCQLKLDALTAWPSRLQFFQGEKDKQGDFDAERVFSNFGLQMMRKERGGFRVPNIPIDSQVCMASLVESLQFQIQRQWKRKKKANLILYKIRRM